MVVGTRLGIITNSKNNILNLKNKIIHSIFLKLFIFPLIIFFVTKSFNFNSYQTAAIVLQAATPSAISTILMAEAYKNNQRIAAAILFTTTLISIITIPLYSLLLNSS